MICKKCKAKIPLTDGKLEGKCAFCGTHFVVRTEEEEQLYARVEAHKASLKNFDALLKHNRDELQLLKKTTTTAIQVIALFVAFILAWHFGSERSFKSNPVVLVFVSILVVPTFIIGYLGGIVLAFKFSQQVQSAPQGAIILAICTLNVSSVVSAILFLATNRNKKAKKEHDRLTRHRQACQDSLDSILAQISQLETAKLGEVKPQTTT
jgi:hypothetical protein